jgi:hypothetical protein
MAERKGHEAGRADTRLIGGRKSGLIIVACVEWGATDTLRRALFRFAGPPLVDHEMHGARLEHRIARLRGRAALELDVDIP